MSLPAEISHYLDRIQSDTQSLEDLINNDSGEALAVERFGEQLDGDVVKVPADGIAFTREEELDANETYTSPWIDTDGFRSLEIFIESDVVSAPGGLTIQYTDDVQTDNPEVRGEIDRRYDNASVDRGFLTFGFPPLLDGYRVIYENGGTATSDFYLSSTVRVHRTEPSAGPLKSEIEAKDTVQFNRSVVAGQDLNDNTKNARVLKFDQAFNNLNQTFGLVNYGDRALQEYAEDEVRTRQVDPRGNLAELGQTDFDFVNGVTVAGDGEAVASLRAPGGDSVSGQAKSTGQFSIRVRWLDENFNQVRDEGVISNREGGAWANYSLAPKSPFVDVVVVEESGNQQTMDITAHYQ